MVIQRWRVRLVAQQIREGAVIAYPAEGVWGLGCLPENAGAVARILALKGRSWDKGLILVAGEVSQIEAYLGGITATARQQLDETWPGPVTWLIPDEGVAPEWIRGKNQSVAIRVSSHPIIRAICAELGGPMVSTSANPAGKRPAKTPLRLRQYFPEGIDVIVPGNLGGLTGPTEIRELHTGRIERPASTRSH